MAIMLLSLSTWQGFNLVTKEFSVYLVPTGSMEPYIPVGSIVLVRNLNSDSGEMPSIGDIIVYIGGGGRAFAHRVVDYTDDGRIVVKGDATDTIEVVEPSNVVGIVVAGIPRGLTILKLISVILFLLLIMEFMKR